MRRVLHQLALGVPRVFSSVAVGPYTRKIYSWQDYVHAVAIATSFSHEKLRHGCNSSVCPFSYSSILGCFLGHTRVSRKPSSTAPSVRPFTACVVAGADGGARPAARHRFTRSTTIGLVRHPASASPMGTSLPCFCNCRCGAHDHAPSHG